MTLLSWGCWSLNLLKKRMMKKSLRNAEDYTVGWPSAHLVPFTGPGERLKTATFSQTNDKNKSAHFPNFLVFWFPAFHSTVEIEHDGVSNHFDLRYRDLSFWSGVTIETKYRYETPERRYGEVMVGRIAVLSLSVTLLFTSHSRSLLSGARQRVSNIITCFTIVLRIVRWKNGNWK